jgi:hypothetical protein
MADGHSDPRVRHYDRPTAPASPLASWDHQAQGSVVRTVLKRPRFERRSVEHTHTVHKTGRLSVVEGAAASQTSSSRINSKAMGRPSGRCCRAWSLASIAISTTAPNTPTNRRARGNGGCSGSNPPGMRHVSCRRMALFPRTSVLDATCDLLPCSAKPWPKDSGSGGRSRARRWPRKGRVRCSPLTSAPCDGIRMNELTKPKKVEKRWTGGL